jgi:glycosyltransferase involved in cell wall biosynthesis
MSLYRTLDKKMTLFTLRNPIPPRYSKMFSSVKKVFRANLTTGTLVPTMNLKMNFGAFFAYANLFPRVLINEVPSIVDINALACARLNIRKDMVVDCRTPLSYELEWLGHGILSSFARVVETAIKNVGLIIAVNEPLANYCANLGAKNIIIVPNYPTKAFRSSVNSEKWKTLNNLSANEHVVLFSGGVRLKEIYGLNLLLESWKLVEESNDFGTLVMLGNDSIDQVKHLSHSLGIKRLLLPGRVDMGKVANWVNCADVCVAPRTPGFSDAFYNDKDSNKIAEYASFGKPIVANSYAPSKQYLLVSANPAAFSEGIMKGLEGKISPPKPHYWEENEPMLLQSLNHFWSK